MQRGIAACDPSEGNVMRLRRGTHVLTTDEPCGGDPPCWSHLFDEETVDGDGACPVDLVEVSRSDAERGLLALPSLAHGGRDCFGGRSPLSSGWLTGLGVRGEAVCLRLKACASAGLAATEGRHVVRVLPAAVKVSS